MRLKEIDELKPARDEAVIKVSAAGICGTDLRIYQGKYPGINTPIILGHEFSGQIASVGKGVEGLSIGTKVTAHPRMASCGVCETCLNGKSNVCRQKTRLGFELDGAFAEFVKVHKDQIHVLPNEMELNTAALIEPVSVVVHALHGISIKPSDVVLVIGPGTIGLIALLLSKANGAAVAISGLSKDKQKLLLAEKLGADLIINAEKKSSNHLLLEMTNGEGADIVIECTGTPGGVNNGLSLCRIGGKYIQIGTSNESMTVDFMKVAYKEIEIIGSYSHTKRDWEESIKLIHEGKIDVHPLIQDVYSLEEWETAFKVAEIGEKVKVLLKP